MQPIQVSGPMELIHLDFLTLGGKARDVKGTNIMVITDHFTRYAQAYVTLKQTAVVVAHTLWENFLVHYGWPEKILTDQGKSFKNNLFRELCSLAKVKKLCTSPYHPETNGQCEHFNATLISMVGTLPSHAKKDWQEWITTLTHAYNCTVSSVMGFSPYFLMFGRNPKLPLDIDLGIPTIEQESTSQQSYAQKLCSRLQWAYKRAQENSRRESEHHKKYYDQRVRCMELKPDDLVRVRIKALTGDHKIADQWENTLYQVINQLDDQPVFKVRPIMATSDEDTRVLHRNMLLPIKASEGQGNAQSMALMKANLLMDLHFSD